MAMALEVHVWGPAFGLPSIDAECLAVISYLTCNPARAEWRLIANSPSGVPTHTLPSLYDPSTQTWHAGLSSIIAHPALRNPEPLTPKRQADTTAYSAFLSANATPLLALSLYSSTANWVQITRPAYSEILPFPLTWTEPTRVRNEMDAQAAHLGIGLDEDADAEDGEDGRFLKVPESLRRKKPTVKDAMAPEMRARLRLERAADEVLAVVSDVDLDYLDNGMLPMDDLNCQVYAYLALMYKPHLPRAWLRDHMVKQYPSLCELVDSFQRLMSKEVLPWSVDTRSSSLVSITSRFAQAVLRVTPGFGEDWHQATLRWRKEGITSADVIVAMCTALAGAAVVGSAITYQSMMPFGSPVTRFEKMRSGFRGLGSVGDMFGFSRDFGGASEGGSPSMPGTSHGGSEVETVEVEVGGPSPGVEVGVGIVEN